MAVNLCSSQEAFADAAVQQFESVSRTSSPSWARIRQRHIASNVFVVESVWAQRDLVKKEKRRYKRTNLLSFPSSAEERRRSGEANISTIDNLSFQVTELCNVGMISLSPSERFVALLKSESNNAKDSEKKQYLEIWQSDCLLHCVNLSDSKKHGIVFDDAMFGSLEWSSSEDRILFIAERYRPKAASYFDKNDKSSESSSYVRGAEHLFFEEWGELLTKHHCPVPVIFSLETKDCQAVDCDLSVGQALWGPHDDSLIFIGWDNEPRRLGLIFCSNRKSAVYLYNLQDLKLEELSGADLSVTSPRLNSDKTKLVYLGNIVGGPHKSCMRLMMLDLGTRETVTLVDIVNSPGEGGFPGLYVDALPSRCWSSDDSKIIFSSIWQSKQEILCVDISSASVFKISPDGVAGCWSVLDVFDDLVTCSFASPSSPSRLMIGLLGEPQAGSSIQIEGMTTIASSYGNFENDLSWEIIKLKPSVGDSRIFYEAVLIRPVQTDDVKPPLIVTPHGGPHSCAVADFSVSTTTLCLLGFAVLLVNYRGSIGFGQDSIDALLGNIGKIDVCDVQDAAVNVIQSGVVDPTRILVHGGSHGGFLSCHLIGQFPEFYKAACVRNPVTNIAAMVGVSDIPDWCHTEVGLLYNVWTTVSTADTLTKMINVSPIRYADKVKTPILFLVGAQDLRVPPPQSHEMHYALKARHVRTKMLVYDKSSHPLMEVDVEADAFVNMVLWFYDHLSSVKKI